MKLRAELKGVECELTLDSTESNLIADVCGRNYSIEVQHAGSNRYLFLERGRVYEMRVNPHSGSKQVFDVAIRGKTYSVRVFDPRRLAIDEDSGRHQTGAAEITAPMPGKVVRVLVEADRKVDAGDGVVVVEAMKMQNEMKAPRAGTVVSINVKAGDTVEAGELLAVIE